MLTTLINIFWIIISVTLAAAIILLVLLFALLAIYITVKEEERGKNPEPAAKLTFNGPSCFDMQRTTSRLLKQDKQTTRKYRRPYFQNRVA